jgi:hypothetical protein
LPVWAIFAETGFPSLLFLHFVLEERCKTAVIEELTTSSKISR